MKKAVALKYAPPVPAPFIVAKGGGEWAKRLLMIAAQNGISVKQDPGLAEGLFAFEAGECIPPAYYEAIAEIFAFIVKIRERP